MKFIIYTSLTSLLLLIFWFLILRKIYRRIKPGIDATFELVDSAAIAIGSSSKEFLGSLNSELIEFNSKCTVNEFKRMLDNNNKCIEYCNKLIKNDQTREQIKQKSIDKLHKKYKMATIELKKNKLDALKFENDKLHDTIERFENKLDLYYQSILKLKEFVMLDIVLDESNKEIDKLTM
ncbi:MAG: hypothetical protein IJU79_03000 [Desulfovibrionaceae bacterium]|nr:hypothetical protein [Desulfovibrionaceae bacterium]